eukprot:sb/3473017/
MCYSDGAETETRSGKHVHFKPGYFRLYCRKEDNPNFPVSNHRHAHRIAFNCVPQKLDSKYAIIAVVHNSHVSLNNKSRHEAGQSDTSKQPIRTLYLSHVTGYPPIRDQYFLIRSVPKPSLPIRNRSRSTNSALSGYREPENKEKQLFYFRLDPSSMK